MRKSLPLIFAITAILFGCGGDKDNDTKNGKQAKGDAVYGGVFRMNEVEDFRNLYPLNITEVTSHRITNQVYEGLVKLNQKDLTIIPSIAEKWDVNPDATSFTFYLRKGVKFHDDACFPDGKGREVTANDFKYCLTLLSSSDPSNQGYPITFKGRVIGSDEYFQSTIDKKPLAEGVKGIKVIDDYTIQINLNYSFAGFINIMATPFTWVFPKEAYEKYGIEMRAKCVGTGPFRVKDVKEGEAVILVRNENYWNIDQWGNQLPYLEAVKFTFIKEKKSELLEFKKGNLDMVFQLPIEMISDVLGELENAKEGNIPFEMQVSPSMAVQYYGFQHQSDLFKNKLVRQAFNYAIDREKIVNFTLQGEGLPGKFGIVPPSFAKYNNEKLMGYVFDPDKAKKLFREAGYPDGKGFPKLTLQLNSGGSRNIQIAEVIQKMLGENLNIEIELNVMPFAQHLENLETGKALFWRSAWIADYPDPENFLTLLYSGHIPPNLSDKSYVNSVRYKNEKFDEVFMSALKEVDEAKRMELYLQADQIAIDDAAIMPIFYDEHYRLLQINVNNFDANAMEYRDLSQVYFKERKKEQAESSNREQ